MRVNMSRKIICADAIKWLESQREPLANVITGIPDQGELKKTMPDYIRFFEQAARLIFQKVDPEGYIIFIQTDRKADGRWLDKSAILTHLARTISPKWDLKWHKIVLQREPGACDIHRPSYSHILCYSIRRGPGEVTPDVLPVSEKIYANGTPIGAATFAVDFVKRYGNKQKLQIVDPFVGQGTICALANSRGLDTVGIDIDPEQCRKAEQCRLEAGDDLTATGRHAKRV